MVKILEKVERRLGEKLLLKGDRCIGPKCAQTRRSYPPGAHGKKRKRGLSEFGELMREKQKVRFLYGLDDKDVRRYSQKAALRPGVYSANFLSELERRLDNVVWRFGFAPSRRSARHLVSYGHITVNGRTVKIPSYAVKKGDMVAIKERSQGKPVFDGLETRLKKHEPPRWLALEPAKRVGTVTGFPDAGEEPAAYEATKIKEFYSR